MAAKRNILLEKLNERCCENGRKPVVISLVNINRGSVANWEQVHEIHPLVFVVSESNSG